MSGINEANSFNFQLKLKESLEIEKIPAGVITFVGEFQVPGWYKSIERKKFDSFSELLFGHFTAGSGTMHVNDERRTIMIGNRIARKLICG